MFITVLAFIISMLVNYLFCGAFSLEYGNVYYIVAISALVYAICSYLAYSELGHKLNKNEILFSILIFSMVLVAGIASGETVNSEAYANLLKVEEKNDMKSLIEEKEIRVISKDMAFKAANKIMGITNKDVILSSQYSIETEDATLQTVNGKLVWVFPLDYMSFFKWLNQDNIPGYITVSATNNEEPAKLVLKDFKIGFNGFLSDRAERKMLFSSNFKLVNTHFEIDDNGNPYYIGLIKTPKILFGGYVIEKVVVLNAKTQESETLTIEEAHIKYPWIDHFIVNSLSLEQIENKGLYSEGWLNSIFKQNNVKKPTMQYLTTISVNKELWSFTGITSLSSKDQSLIEGIFINNITGKAIILPLSEITNEEGAIQQMESALGSDSIKWNITLPQPLIINEEFYWLGTVVSESNLYQKVMAVNGKNVSKVYEAKEVSSLIFKIKNETEEVSGDEEETIVIKKSIYNKLLKVVSDIDEIKKELSIK